MEDKKDLSAVSGALGLIKDCNIHPHNEDIELPNSSFIHGHEQDLFVIDDIIYKNDIRTNKICTMTDDHTQDAMSTVDFQFSNNQWASSAISAAPPESLFIWHPSTPVLEINHFQSHLNIQGVRKLTDWKKVQPIKGYTSGKVVASNFHFFRNEPGFIGNDDASSHALIDKWQCSVHLKQTVEQEPWSKVSRFESDGIKGKHPFEQEVTMKLQPGHNYSDVLYPNIDNSNHELDIVKD